MPSKPLLQTPFLTESFRDDGGGIDFLGLRLINLRMLAQNLLPGVNNATRDIGIFYLGVWIPWKFKQVCAHRPKDYTEEKYKAFRQALEVVMADGIKDGSSANQQFGTPNPRIGVSQILSLPGELIFSDEIHRTEATSLYAAPLYGPSLRYLNFIGYAAGENGKIAQIHVPHDDLYTQRVCEYVDSIIGDDPLIEKIAQFNFHTTEEEINNLQCRGLHPRAFQHAPAEVQDALIHHLLDTNQDDVLNQRFLTTRLIIETLKSQKQATSQELRSIWLTGLISDGIPLQLSDEKIQTQRLHWALFESRQHQRYILERFLIHFEEAINEGCSSIEEITTHSLASFENNPKSIHALIEHESALAGSPTNLEDPSEWWSLNIGKDHDFSENTLKEKAEPNDLESTFIMLARWILRIRVVMKDRKDLAELSWGSESRISMRWFYKWATDNQDLPLTDFLKDLYSNLVFTQHLRVGLSRLNPNEPMQRLRFVLGDQGITATAGMSENLGNREAPWMADRLDAWLDLLAEVKIVSKNEDGVITLGSNADSI